MHNEIQPLSRRDTGELSLSEQAYWKRWLQTEEGQREAAQVVMPELDAWRWQRDSLESTHLLNTLNERMELTNILMQYNSFRWFDSNQTQFVLSGHDGHKFIENVLAPLGYVLQAERQEGRISGCIYSQEGRIVGAFQPTTNTFTLSNTLHTLLTEEPVMSESKEYIESVIDDELALEVGQEYPRNETKAYVVFDGGQYPVYSYKIVTEGEQHYAVQAEYNDVLYAVAYFFDPDEPSTIEEANMKAKKARVHFYNASKAGIAPSADDIEELIELEIGVDYLEDAPAPSFLDDAEDL